MMKVFKIENNLYDLYRKMGEFDTYQYNEDELCSVVSSEQMEWPEFIFDINNKLSTEQTLEIITQEVEKGEKPRFLIIRDTQELTKFREKLKHAGFLPVVRWPAMLLDLSEYFVFRTKEKRFKIKVVKKQSELEQWIELANKSLFTKKGLKSSVFSRVLIDKEINLIIALMDNQPVGTLFTFSRNKCTGFYMISTHPEFRGLGCMNAMMKFAIDKAIERKDDFVVLEANNLSCSIYDKMGFERVFNYDIYWKREKEG